MRVADISLYYDEDVLTEELLLEKHYTTVGWAEALNRKGIEVIVLKRFSKDSVFTKNGVQYYFIKDGFGGSLKHWHIPYRFLKKIRDVKPDIIHAHSFPASFPIFVLRFMLPGKTALVIQNHGGLVSSGAAALMYRYLSHTANAFFFTDTRQGSHWFKNKSLLKKIMPVMEGATFFDYQTRDVHRLLVYHDRKFFRAQTGMQGDPVFLWVGRLDSNKDPLTILEGMERIFMKYTHASLYMIYSDEKLLNKVIEKIESSKELKKNVFLLGHIAHNMMEQFYNSATYFVLGSHYEGSGFALSEALGCGCIPIITDIPSFRMMTAEGKLGALWQTGNKDSFVAAVDSAMQKPLQEEAMACIEFFKNNLSFDAIAGVAVQHYQAILDRKR